MFYEEETPIVFSLINVLITMMIKSEWKIFNINIFCIKNNKTLNVYGMIGNLKKFYNNIS